MTLSWLANVEDEEIYGDIQYQVEYNRETWDIWLKVRIIQEYPKKLFERAIFQLFGAKRRSHLVHI